MQEVQFIPATFLNKAKYFWPMGDFYRQVPLYDYWTAGRERLDFQKPRQWTPAITVTKHLV